GQPDHAAEAVRVGVDVGNEDDTLGVLQPGQEPVRPPQPGCGGFPVTVPVRVGAATRHGGATSVNRETPTSCGESVRTGAMVPSVGQPHFYLTGPLLPS